MCVSIGLPGLDIGVFSFYCYFFFSSHLVLSCLLLLLVESAFVLYNWMCVCVCVQENACGEGKVNARILLIPNGMQRNTIH